ncbi:uncharacterized protein ISCGN_032260 [Ixodes scapularis]
MESAAACSSVDRNHQPHTANAEEEENDMRMLQDPPSTTGDDEHDMAPWIKVTSRAIRRKTRASLATQTLNLSPPKPALRPSRPVLKPKPPPLPADDFKLAIRPRNGLVLSKVSPMVLSNSIMREAKVRPQEADIKIRVNEQQNILVASTPYQSTASSLSKIQKLTIGETTYAIASYGISPDNSCRGVIHSREKEATNEELLEAISAPGYEPLTCRRFGDSDTILITYIGKKVPFLIYVGGVETRCFLYKRTVAYCYVCHQTGHRADVCPYPPDVPTCKDCEALLTAEPHECKPKCSLCSGEHRTASKACPGRFLPPVNRRKEQTSIGRRRPRTPSGQRGDPSSRSSAARSRSRSYPRLTQDRRRRSSRSRSRSKTRGRTPSTQERIETQQSTQAIHKAGGQPLLIMGDFNAAHQLWGYAYSNKRGHVIIAAKAVDVYIKKAELMPAVVGLLVEERIIHESLMTMSANGSSGGHLRCADEDFVICYLLDDGGFIITSSGDDHAENVGKFVGAVDPELMDDMLKKSVYFKIEELHTESRCPRVRKYTAGAMSSMLVNERIST